MIAIGDTKLGRMGDPAWGSQLLGYGNRTIGQSGCLMSCLWFCSRILAPGKAPADIGATNKLLQTIQGAFSGSGQGPARQAVAHALGMHFAGVEHNFSAELVATRLAVGLPTILGVDYKPGASSGESDADHFVVAVDAEREGSGVSALHCYDPATGEVKPWRLLGMAYKNHPARFTEMRLYAAA